MTNDAVFTAHDYAIGGKLVVGRATMDDSYLALMREEDAKKHIKERLVKELAMYMLENNLVEFTQYRDPMTLHTQVAVRAYLAPSDQVKILRLANKIV
jgi:hypothetical protein